MTSVNSSPSFNNPVPQTNTENAPSPSKSRFNFGGMALGQETAITEAFAGLEPLSEADPQGEMQPIENSFSTEVADPEVIGKTDHLGRVALNLVTSALEQTSQKPEFQPMASFREKVYSSESITYINPQKFFLRDKIIEKVGINKLGIPGEHFRLAELHSKSNHSLGERSEYDFAIFKGKSDEGTIHFILEDSFALANRSNLSDFVGWMNTEMQDITWTETFKNNQESITENIAFIPSQNNREENKNINDEFIIYNQRFCDDEEILTATQIMREQCKEYYAENPYRPAESIKAEEKESGESKNTSHRDDYRPARYESHHDEKKQGFHKEKGMDQSNKASQIEKSVGEQKDIELSAEKERDLRISKEMDEKSDEKRYEDIQYHEKRGSQNP